jgi:cob(I)alamin adenosyltransferase
MSKKFPWYTARGDDGTTGLLGAGRVPKHHPQKAQVEAANAAEREAGSLVEWRFQRNQGNLN